ncbi:hypothetical protein [Staphylococcus pettenkoferi]|uniref:hypothetical protein n=1 Tax=Staphylococcus pettenkoferi TaxID=170573 RepID=UPI0025527BE4|nr:hypothetical protein [Staphylococcus pettenkoferi]MDK7284307.1 hypothetical protein [Staphylococcus pettenkoferi]
MEISPEMKARLERNNIPEKTFEKRLYKGESVEEASTRPLQKKTLDKATKETLRKNKIKYTTYWQRVNRGMTPEEAMTKPPQKSNKLTEKEKEIIKEYGVSEQLATRRLRYPNWTREEALTTPPSKS